MAGTSGARTPIYCTIVAANYLSKALALAESLAQHTPDGTRLRILLVEGDAVDPLGRGVEFFRPTDIGLTRQEFEGLAAAYNVIELSTALKPLFMRHLQAENPRVVYLDPDFWITGPLEEIDRGLDESPILLTPHFLDPIAPGTSHMSEMHSLALGVYNLGFCAVNGDAGEYLDWWWSHLRHECLIYPLMHLFVDQKWADVGSVMFGARPFTHAGYNVGPWNLHERPIGGRAADPVVHRATGDVPLRIVHFSGFDPQRPHELSTRLNASLRDSVGETETLDAIASEYAAMVLKIEGSMGGAPTGYSFDLDSSGRRMTTRLRRSCRKALIEGADLPSAFDLADADRWRQWRRRSLRDRASSLVVDSTLAGKYVFPDEFKWVVSRSPKAFRQARARLLDAGQVRR